MTKKVKVLLSVAMLLLCFMILQLSAMHYCNIYTGECFGMCGCEGEVSQPYEDPCCFMCTYFEEEIECCRGMGIWDGCFYIEAN